MRAYHDLTLPEVGSTTVRALLSASLRRLAADLVSLRDPALREVLALVRRELSEEPGRVLAILRRPTVSTAIRVLRARPDPRVTAQLAATLAVELAVAGAHLPPLALAPGSRVACLGGLFALPAGPARLIDGRWHRQDRVIDLGAPDDRPYHAIDRSLVLATVDDNPLAMEEAHPEKGGNAVDLGGEDPAAWTRSLADALTRIATYLPRLREEAALLLSQILPVGVDAHRHVSASYAEAIGTVYLSLHPDPMTMTEAVIHELSHHKLNLALEEGPFLDNAHFPLYTSPVRPDPRPLHGVLLAVHAFVPVEALYRAMRDRASEGEGEARATTPPFERRMAEVILKNRQGLEVLLAHAQPTARGAALLDELARHVAAWDGSATPPA